MKRTSFVKSSGFGLTGIGLTTTAVDMDKGNEPLPSRPVPDEDEDLTLNFHLMYPGGSSDPEDPNAAFFLDGTYHLKPGKNVFGSRMLNENMTMERAAELFKSDKQEILK